MMIYFDGTIKETNNCKGIWLNTIDVQLKTGQVLTLDRNTTFYYVNDENDTFTMEWEGVYVWDGKTEDYDLDKYDWTDVKLWFVDIEDDADEDYRLRIENIEFALM